MPNKKPTIKCSKKEIAIKEKLTENQLVARLIANFTGVHTSRILAGKYGSAVEALLSARLQTGRNGHWILNY